MTRWADDDVYGHLSNATYYELFDTAVNAHLIEAASCTCTSTAPAAPAAGPCGRSRIRSARW